MCYEKFNNQDSNEESGSLTNLEERMSNLEDTIDMLSMLCEAVEKIDLLFDAVTDLKKSVDSLRERMCGLNNSLKESRKDLNIETFNNIKPLSRISKSHVAHFSEAHKNELEIVGIPFKEDENIVTTVLECAKKVDVNLERSDLTTAYRGKRLGGNDGIIHISFKNTQKCNEFMSKCKAKRISTQVLGFNGNCRPVFVNKPLSAFSKRLLYKSKQFKAEFQWQFLWTRNGRIYLKKSQHDKPVHITSEQDLFALRM